MEPPNKSYYPGNNVLKKASARTGALGWGGVGRGQNMSIVHGQDSHIIIVFKRT